MNPLHVIAGVTIGAGFGYGYYRVIGCRSGVCPITARWWTSTLYGAFLGFLATRH